MVDPSIQRSNDLMAEEVKLDEKIKGLEQTVARLRARKAKAITDFTSMTGDEKRILHEFCVRKDMHRRLATISEMLMGAALSLRVLSNEAKMQSENDEGWDDLVARVKIVIGVELFDKLVECEQASEEPTEEYMAANLEKFLSLCQQSFPNASASFD